MATFLRPILHCFHGILCPKISTRWRIFGLFCAIFHHQHHFLLNRLQLKYLHHLHIQHLNNQHLHIQDLNNQHFHIQLLHVQHFHIQHLQAEIHYQNHSLDLMGWTLYSTSIKITKFNFATLQL